MYNFHKNINRNFLKNCQEHDTRDNGSENPGSVGILTAKLSVQNIETHKTQLLSALKPVVLCQNVS